MRRLTCLLSMVLTGCVVSVQPVVSAAGSTFDTRLLGTWGDADGKDRIVITRGDANVYELEYTDSDGKVGSFEARLGKLGTRTVLDVRPAPRESSPMPEAASLIRGHILYVLSIAPDSVLVSLLNPKALRDAIKSNAVALGSLDDHDQVVLTGNTAELRRVLASYIERPRALDEPSTWKRVVQREVGPDSVEKELRAELGVMRSAAAAADWSRLKRFFRVGTVWAAQAEAWVTKPDSQSLGFFARGAQSKVGEIRVRVVNRDTADVLVPYVVMGDHAYYAARLVLQKSGWVLLCSQEAHGFPITVAGCAGSPVRFQP